MLFETQSYYSFFSIAICYFILFSPNWFNEVKSLIITRLNFETIHYLWFDTVIIISSKKFMKWKETCPFGTAHKTFRMKLQRENGPIKMPEVSRKSFDTLNVE